MNLNAIISVLMTALVVGMIVVILKMYIEPHVVEILPEAAKNYADAIFAIMLLFIIGMVKLPFANYIETAAVVMLVMFMAKKIEENLSGR